MRIKEIKCPCGVKSKTEIWKTLNASINPKAKEKLLEGKLNQFLCKGCGTDIFIGGDLLYHDMKIGYLVQYFDSVRVDDKRFLDMFSEKAKLKVLPPILLEDAAEYFDDVHVVFSMGELVEYVIFRDKLAEHRAGGSNN